MNRDSSINNSRRFERASEVLAQLNISVQDAAGNFRNVSEVINDLLAVNRALSFNRSIFNDEFLVAEAYDLITSELETPEFITTRNPYRSINHENDRLDTWDYIEMIRASSEPKAANTQTDEINMAAHKDYKPSKELNDFLSAFKVIEKGVESK